MKKKHVRANDQVQRNRLNFVHASREMAFRSIEREVEALDGGDFNVRALLLLDPAMPVESGCPDYYCVIDVVHKKWPHVYAARHPVSLAYPNAVYLSILRTLLAIAKGGCNEHLN